MFKDIFPTALIAAGLSVATVQAQLMQMSTNVDQELRYAASASYAFPSELHLGSRDVGDMDTFHWRLSVTPAFRVSERYFWYAGLDLSNFRFDVPGAAPVPESLYGVSMRLGSQWRISEKWALQTQVSPGIYSDFDDIDWGDVNVPVLVLAQYDLTPQWRLYAGAQADFRRDVPVIPALGARWRMAEDWTLFLVFPMPRVEYRVNQKLTAYAGVEFVRSAFRVGEHFGDDEGRPELNDEIVSYQDWRVGAGARWRVMNRLSVFAEAGWLVDRRFHYDDEDLLVNGDGAPYLQLGLNGSF